MGIIAETDKCYVANTYNRFPVEIICGKGSYAYSADGKKYIDMGAGIGVASFGYCDEAWQSAVAAQAARVQHTSNLYYSEPCSTLAKMLCDRTGMKKVFFANSGAEANECAVKAARKYAEKKGEGFYNIITLKNSFHGRTLTTLAATGQDIFHKLFLPLTEGFIYADATDAQSVKKLAKYNKTAAIMIECIQGEGGVNVLDADYVKEIYEFAVKEDILFIVDEVQTGNGRTGELYSYMNYGIKPDIVTTAKGLGGGLPIGAAILGEKVADVLGFGEHGSTYGGNPVCCAAAISVLKRIDEKLLAQIREKGKYICDALEKAKGVVSVNGMGLMLGIQTERNVGEVVVACVENGVLPLTAKNKIRLLPALNIPYEAIDEALEVIKKACAGEI